MAKHLVIVESPAKSKTISKFLGKDYEISASYGHVRDLPKGKLGIDVKENFEPTYVKMKDKSKVLKSLSEFAKKSDLVYIATDPDREGEAIAWHIINALKLKPEQTKRIVFNEITKNAVQTAITNSRDIDMSLVDAQQARRILDRLIGYKLSPILSRKIKRGLSAGRVQSVSVKLICDRERAIQAFVPEEYWHIDASFSDTSPKYQLVSRLIAQNDEKQKLDVHSEAEAKALVDQLNQSQFVVDSIVKSQARRKPSLPFITSTLQQEASRKLGWGAKKTMMIAQQLYEGIDVDGEAVGLITYMRTDSTRLSDEATSAAYDYIKDRFGERYNRKSSAAQKKGKNIQDAHEAIRPTGAHRSPDTLKTVLSTDHFKLYQLIWQRFIASQMAECLLDRTKILIKADVSGKDPLILKTTGSVVVFDGFTKLYVEGKDHQDDDDANHDNLPQLTEGQPLKLQDLNSQQKFTQPPARFTEATLVKEMEELGIGRPSTYAPTISTIMDRGYVSKDKKTLVPSELGFIVTEQLEKYFSKIIDTHFTAGMETQLDEIMEGKHTWQSVISSFYSPFSDLIDNAYQNMEKINMDKPSDEVCEKCNSPMVIKAGRFGDFLACSNFPDCKNTQSIVVSVDVDCPDCGSPIHEKKSRKGKVFYGCSGFPKCKYALWDKPVKQTCPDCKSPVMCVKKTKKDTETTYCPQCK